VILANGWPSWLEILPAIGFQDIKVWYQDPDLLETFYDDLNKDCILHELNDLAHISRFMQPMLFISSFRSFVKRIKAQFRHLCIWASVLADGPSGSWSKFQS
jgi:hypothetical protein